MSLHSVSWGMLIQQFGYQTRFNFNWLTQCFIYCKDFGPWAIELYRKPTTIHDSWIDTQQYNRTNILHLQNQRCCHVVPDFNFCSYSITYTSELPSKLPLFEFVFSTFILVRSKLQPYCILALALGIVRMVPAKPQPADSADALVAAPPPSAPGTPQSAIGQTRAAPGLGK